MANTTAPVGPAIACNGSIAQTFQPSTSNVLTGVNLTLVTGPLLGSSSLSVTATIYASSTKGAQFLSLQQQLGALSASAVTPAAGSPLYTTYTCTGTPISLVRGSSYAMVVVVTSTDASYVPPLLYVNSTTYKAGGLYQAVQGTPIQGDLVFTTYMRLLFNT